MNNVWQTTFYGVLLDSDSLRVLMHFSESHQCYVLPSFSYQTDGLWLKPNDYSGILAEFNNTFQCDLNILRRISIEQNKTRKHSEIMFTLEAHSGCESLGHWLSAQDLSSVILKNPEHLEGLTQFLLDPSQTSLQRQPEWSCLGWYEGTYAWIVKTLNGLGYSVDKINLVKTWNISCVLCVKTDRGNVFFKSNYNFPLFTNELVLLPYLTHSFPDNIPNVLATDKNKGFLILKGYRTLLDEPPKATYYSFLETAVKVHRTYINKHSELLQLGCPDRRIHHLVKSIAKILEAPYVQASLSLEEHHFLTSNLVIVQKLSEYLSKSAIPETLIHGDLHTGNVAYADETPIILDWTDASICHPFLDIMLDLFFYDDQDLASNYRDYYLSFWLDYASKKELLQLWSATKFIFVFHQAITYHSFTVSMDEANRFEFQSSCLEYLQKGISNLKDILASKNQELSFLNLGEPN